MFVLNKQVKQKFGSSHSNVFLKVGVPREKWKSRKNPWRKTLKELAFGKVVVYKFSKRDFLHRYFERILLKIISYIILSLYFLKFNNNFFQRTALGGCFWKLQKLNGVPEWWYSWNSKLFFRIPFQFFSSLIFVNLLMPGGNKSS